MDNPPTPKVRVLFSYSQMDISCCCAFNVFPCHLVGGPRAVLRPDNHAHPELWGSLVYRPREPVQLRRARAAVHRPAAGGRRGDENASRGFPYTGHGGAPGFATVLFTSLVFFFFCLPASFFFVLRVNPRSPCFPRALASMAFVALLFFVSRHRQVFVQQLPSLVLIADRSC